MANKFMVKREIKIFLISFVFTNICLIYYSSSLFQRSLLEAIKNIFSFEDLTTILITLLVYVIGYLIFTLLYLFIKYILKKKKLSPLKATVATLSMILIIFFLNDQLIISVIKVYPTIGYFQPLDVAANKMDSTNFYEYDWIKKSIDFDGYLEKEKIVFTSNNLFQLSGTRIKIDRLYIFRRIFNSIDTYEIKGKYVYENAIFIVDSLNHTYSIQIRKNRLYLNSIVNAI
jgi:hypothetical protein